MPLNEKVRWYASRFSALLLIALCFLTWVLTPSLTTWWMRREGYCPQDLGAFGDQFAVTGTLFSALALFGVIVSLYLQQGSLRLQQHEQSAAEQINRTERRLQARAALIGAIPGLIADEEKTLATIEPTMYAPGTISALGRAGIRLRLAQALKDFRNHERDHKARIREATAAEERLRDLNASIRARWDGLTEYERLSLLGEPRLRADTERRRIEALTNDLHRKKARLREHSLICTSLRNILDLQESLRISVEELRKIADGGA